MTTTKDVMKDSQSVKELFYFKNGLTFPNKNCREISYMYLFCKNEETNYFSSLKKITYSMYCINKIYKNTTWEKKVESSLNASLHTNKFLL